MHCTFQYFPVRLGKDLWNCIAGAEENCIPPKTENLKTALQTRILEKSEKWES